MSMLAATTAAVLLIASPSPGSGDAAGLAAKGGFLLGNAQRCGIESDRVMRAGRLVRDLIKAEAGDAQEQDEAIKLLARFYVVSATAKPTGQKPVASCPLVTTAFEEFEKHQPAAQGSSTGGGEAGSSTRPGAGE